jgi:hypothetical protein
MGRLDQETQIRNSDSYDDTITAGPGMESPASADQHIQFDLNALRSQVLRLLDPQKLTGTADWFVDVGAALNNFGLRQIHDKKFAFRSLITPGTTDFILGQVEIHSVDTVAEGAGLDNNDYFIFYDAPYNAYYVWYDVAGGGTDPAPTPPGSVSYTGIQVAIAAAETANNVASLTQTAIQGSSAQVTVGLASGNQLTITNKYPAAVTDAADGANPTTFTIGTDQQGADASDAGVLIDASMIIGGSGTIAVGPSSGEEGGYIAANEANFTIAGTLGVGLSQAVDSDSLLLNKVDILDDLTNEPPEDGGVTVFGLLQTVTGTADGAAITPASSENLQISFVKIEPVTDVLTSVSLPEGYYHFSLTRQRCFYSLPRGSLISGIGKLPDEISPGESNVPRLPFRHFDVGGLVLATDPLNIQSGVFVTAGATAVFATYGTPILPSSAAEFRDDARVKIWRNGNLQSKGTGKDVVYVGPTQISFSKNLKPGDEIVIESPSVF